MPHAVNIEVEQEIEIPGSAPDPARGDAIIILDNKRNIEEEEKIIEEEDDECELDYRGDTIIVRNCFYKTITPYLMSGKAPQPDSKKRIK